MRKTYRQHCGLARALDALGERWTLLVVRQLLLGPRRYSELSAELLGITTNLLAKRLREMESAGIVERRPAPPPARGEVYALTEAGRELEPAIMALGRWGGRFMTGGPGPGDRVDLGWALLASKRRYRGGVSLVAELRQGDRVFELELEPTRALVSEGPSSRADLVVVGDLPALVGLLRGAGEQLREKGALQVSGSATSFRKLTRAFADRDLHFGVVMEPGSGV